MEWKFNWVDPFINKEVIPPWAQRLQATRTRSLRIISCFPLLRICWLGSLFTPQCLLFVGSLRFSWQLHIYRRRWFLLAQKDWRLIGREDTHSSPIYLYPSIDLTFGLLNVEGFLHSPAIAMLQPFSKHPLKAVRMINNNLQREGLFWLKLRSWNTGLRPKAAQVHVDLFTTCWH